MSSLGFSPYSVVQKSIEMNDGHSLSTTPLSEQKAKNSPSFGKRALNTISLISGISNINKSINNVKNHEYRQASFQLFACATKICLISIGLIILRNGLYQTIKTSREEFCNAKTNPVIFTYNSENNKTITTNLVFGSCTVQEQKSFNPGWLQQIYGAEPHNEVNNITWPTVESIEHAFQLTEKEVCGTIRQNETLCVSSSTHRMIYTADKKYWDAIASREK